MLPSKLLLGMACLLAWTLPLSAEAPLKRLSVHGYLSQAYAVSDGHQLLGITPEGEVDYRTAALLLRYCLDLKNTFVLQVSHEQNGESPFDDDRGFEIDWVYYEHIFPWGSTVQAGKVPLPFGIYNKIRDVGTILPFYRAPNGIYGESAFISETIDGVVVGHTFAPHGVWSFDSQLYLGGWKTHDSNLHPIRIDDVFGLQFWLETPFDGLRFGLGLRHNDVIGTRNGANTFDVGLFSLDLERARLLLRGEYERIDFKVGDGFDSYHGQLGIRATDRLSVYLQAESSEVRIFSPIVGGSIDLKLADELAVGLAFFFRPDLVLKLETHWNEGISAEDLTVQEKRSGATVKTRFSIVSLSASF